MELFPEVYLLASGEMGLSDPYDCHIYGVRQADRLWLIDSGWGSQQTLAALKAALQAHQLDHLPIGGLLLTHWHGDHANGAAALQQQLGCPVWLPAPEADFVRQGREGLRPCGQVQGLQHLQQVAGFTAYQIPGHSEATTCYLLQQGGRRILFAGDTVFANGVIGLINHPSSDLNQYRQHLPRLAGLAIDALLPGHGMVVLGHGQRHIDLAIHRLLHQPFMPPTVGQFGNTYVRPIDFPGGNQS